MNRAEKIQAVENLKEIFENSTTLIVTHYSGLNVAEITELRNQAREAGAGVQVVKNTLAKIASKGTKFEGVSEYFSGPVAIVYSSDAVSPAKVANDFGKDNEKLKLVGGAYVEQLLDENGIKQLANTPSLDESRAKLVGLFAAPASKLVGVFSAPGSSVATVLHNYADKS